MTKKDIRIGFIARADATGLGNQSQDWVNNFPNISKILLVWGELPFDPKVFEGKELVIAEQGMPSIEEIKKFLKDIDVLMAIETPYNWNIFKMARDVGIKTILAPNYEFFPHSIVEEPDLYLCYNQLTLDYIPEPKVYLQQPLDRKQFEFKKRKEAKTFLFNNGNGGILGRNSLSEFVQAIPLVKSDVKFIIHSQVPFDIINDSRVEAKIGSFSLAEIWAEGDVFVHLRKFGANSLPIQEAMSLGMPILGVDRKPENMFLPRQLLVKPEKTMPIRIREDLIEIEAAIISPIKIAEKIDEIANTDISEYSKMMDKKAEEWSWDNLRGKWMEEITKLVNK